MKWCFQKKIQPLEEVRVKKLVTIAKSLYLYFGFKCVAKDIEGQLKVFFSFIARFG
jgi:hypothetical protein